MRHANAQLQSDRRAEILDAARICFARSGFHQTSMQEICVQAGMSPGNLYRYFRSKEAIIAGIAERDRAEVAEQFSQAEFAPDFFVALEAMARHHFAERSDVDVALCAELMTESRRNPEIGRIYRNFDADVKARLIGMLQQAAERGDISRDVDLEAAVSLLMTIADGVWWRRASNPQFDAKPLVPLFMDVIRHVLRARR
jgi:AcrR family transcriptional regulator